MPNTPIWVDNCRILVQCNQLTDVLPRQSMTCNEKLNSVVRLSVYAAIFLRMLGMSVLILWLPAAAFLATYVVHVIQQRRRRRGNGNDADSADSGITEGFAQFDDTRRVHADAPAFLRTNTTGSRSAPDTPHHPHHSYHNSGTCSDNRTCKGSTPTNPFANVLVTEMQRPQPRACAVRDTPTHREDVDTNFNLNANLVPPPTTTSPNAPHHHHHTDRNLHASQRQFFTMPWTAALPDPDNDFAYWLYDGLPTLKEQHVAVHLPL
jgi:hypothetical protein